MPRCFTSVCNSLYKRRLTNAESNQHNEWENAANEIFEETREESKAGLKHSVAHQDLYFGIPLAKTRIRFGRPATPKIALWNRVYPSHDNQNAVFPCRQVSKIDSMEATIYISLHG